MVVGVEVGETKLGGTLKGIEKSKDFRIRTYRLWQVKK